MKADVIVKLLEVPTAESVNQCEKENAIDALAGKGKTSHLCIEFPILIRD